MNTITQFFGCHKSPTYPFVFYHSRVHKYFSLKERVIICRVMNGIWKRMVGIFKDLFMEENDDHVTTFIVKNNKINMSLCGFLAF